MKRGAWSVERKAAGPALRESLAAKRQGRAEGFTLLEILVALTILIISISALIPLFAVGTVSQKHGIDQAMVSMIAPHITARLQERLTSPSPADLYDQEYSDTTRSYRYDATFAHLEPLNPVRPAFIVKVKVKWTDAGVEHSESFETILLRRLQR